LSNKTALEELRCKGNALTALDASGCTALWFLDCSLNRLAELKVFDDPALAYLFCSHNELAELDVSGCAALRFLDCKSNKLTELELGSNHYLGYDHVKTSGNGLIGYDYRGYYGFICAYPVNGSTFEGFFDERGNLISKPMWNDEYGAYAYQFYSLYYGDPAGTIIARFSGFDYIPGDVDESGGVTVADAITTMRIAMSIIDGSGLNTDAADMDGNGSITISDAIAIMRIAMGLV